jgi:hypothetical protein
MVLGFLKIRQTPPDGYRGGYLLTTDYGRPLEFHFTAPLKISRQERILYGGSFDSFVFAEVLGKPLTDRQGVAPQIVLVDSRGLLELRRKIPAPVVLITKSADGTIHAQPHPDFLQDQSAFEKLKSLVPSGLDWLEPFVRIDQALDEVGDVSNAAA